jgi:hypothetical protein
MSTNGKTAAARKGVTPELVAKWREKLPEICHLVEDLAPRVFEGPRTRRDDDVPESWKELVASMSNKVRVEADRSIEESSRENSIAVRRGLYWSFETQRVARMLEFLFRQILHDIGFTDGTTLVPMALVDKAFLALLIELQNGGKDGRDDGEEYQVRVVEALKSLMPRFDDIAF